MQETEEMKYDPRETLSVSTLLACPSLHCTCLELQYFIAVRHCAHTHTQTAYTEKRQTPVYIPQRLPRAKGLHSSSKVGSYL